MAGVEVPQAPRRVGVGGIPSPLAEGSVEGSPENFRIFVVKIPYFDAFWHVYFLNHTTMEGVLTPSSVRH